jgi:hypothetical protein
MYAGRGPNSKAAGDPPRLTALPSSPIRAVFLDIVGRRTGGEVMHSFTFVPQFFRSKEKGGRQVRREKISVHVTARLRKKKAPTL